MMHSCGEDAACYASHGQLTASVVVHASLGKHGVVLDLRLAHRWAVVADDHQLSYTGESNRSVSLGEHVK